MVHALAEQELVTRERDAIDQRQVRISLSERGRRAVEEEHERMGRLMDARIALLDPSDQEAITRALPALERLLGTESHPCQRKDS
jgi:DNA-binding MarR family transcriptional regulator